MHRHGLLQDNLIIKTDLNFCLWEENKSFSLALTIFLKYLQRVLKPHKPCFAKIPEEKKSKNKSTLESMVKFRSQLGWWELEARSMYIGTESISISIERKVIRRRKTLSIMCEDSSFPNLLFQLEMIISKHKLKYI